MRWALVDLSLGDHEIGRYWTHRGAQHASVRLTEYVGAHPNEVRGLPRALHVVRKVTWW